MRTILLFLIVTCCTGLYGQQVVATAGNTFINANGSISYTIGEGVAQTLKNGDKTLTQGFHQSAVSVTIISELKDLDFIISVFPNPASNELTIKMNKENIEGLHYKLFDMNGKLLKQKDLQSFETKVPVDQLTEGFYIIKLQAGTKELKTFKIIKE